jgi:outer membrane lipase/esterase
MPINACAPRGAHRFARAASASILAVTMLSGATASAQDAPPRYDRLIVFGDSISDSGTYADKAPAGAGRFTTNPDPVWVELIAQGLELDLAPHAAGGTNYAEGGARVAVPRPDAPGNLSRRPVTEQVTDFVANDGVLTAHSLVILQGGGNDVFATRTNGPADTPEDLETLRLAAETLADQASALLVAGAGTLVTTSVPKFEHYNARYEAALAARGLNLLYVDMAGLIAEIEHDPTEFGILNTTDRACRGTALESFICLPQDYVQPNANRTYLYADAVHFTGVVHEIQADLTLAMLRAPSQLAQLPHLVRASVQLEGQLAREQTDTIHMPGWRLIGSVHGARIDHPDRLPTANGQAEVAGLQAGVARSFASGVSAGAYLGWSSGSAQFGEGLGGAEHDSYALTAFAALERKRYALSLSATIGRSDLNDIERHIVLGPASRIERGATDGYFSAFEGRVSYHIPLGQVRVSPFATLRYDRVTVAGYAEAGTRSTQISVADQRLEQFELGGGLRLTPAARSQVTPWLELGYAGGLLDKSAEIAILPSGAPVWFTSTPFAPAGDQLVYGMGVSGALGASTSLGFSIRGRQGEDNQSELYGGLSLSLHL